MIDKIKEIISSHEIEFLKVRGKLHEYPEVSGEEYETSKFLKEFVKNEGLEIVEIGGTGFIVVLDSGKEGKTVALRTDIDALPMQESKYNLIGRKKYISKNNGVCHSCGHDAHMAMLLWSMRVLNQVKESLSGRILFLFEEGEERGLGIKSMLDGLNRFKVDAIWGIHMATFLETGKVSISPGPVMAGVTPFKIQVIGKSGHSSRPDLAINPLFGAAQIITALGSSWANRMDPNKPVTLGLSQISGGTATNIIPEKVDVIGSLRYFDTIAGKYAIELIEKTSNAAAASQLCEVNFEKGYATKPVTNDRNLALMAHDCCSKILSQEYIASGETWYASESFNRYDEICPSILIFLGTKSISGGYGAEAHKDRFDIDESGLINGVKSTVMFAMSYLQEG